MLVLAGGVLAALGMLAALLLLAAPLGLAGSATGWVLWLLFPLFTLLGYALLVVGGRDPAARGPTRWLAAPLLLLALAAATALMAGGAGMLQIETSAPLWYVLALGGALGTLGSAVGAGRPA